jgi:hypothetical protein
MATSACMATSTGLARHGPPAFFLFFFFPLPLESPTRPAHPHCTGTAQNFPPKQNSFKNLQQKLKLETILVLFSNNSSLVDPIEVIQIATEPI